MRRMFALVLLLAASVAGGAGRELAPRELGPTPYSARRPSIAWAGGKFLTVWQESRLGFGEFLLGAVSDSAGRPLGPSFILLPSNQAWFQLVSTGDAFVLFRDAGVTIEMIDIDLAGNITGPRRRIAVSSAGARIAWNGTHFLAVHTANGVTGNEAGVIFTRTGEVVRRNIALTSIASTSAIVPNGDEFMVLSTTRDGLFASRVNAAGLAAQAMIEEGHGFVVGAYTPRDAIGIPRGDGTVLAVWSGGNSRITQLKSAIVGPDGTVREMHLLVELSVSEQVSPLFVMRAGGGYLAAYRERVHELEPYYFMTTLRLDESGALAGPGGGRQLGAEVPVVDAGDGVAGIAYTTLSPLRNRIAQIVVDSAGRMSQEQIVSIARARHLQPVLAAGGGRFLAAFTEHGATVRARTASIAADGEPLEHRLIGDRAIFGRELAWNGTQYLSLLYFQRQLLAQRLTFDGETIGEPLLLVELPYLDDREAAVVWAIDRWFVVWLSDNRPFFATVSPAGIATEPEPLDLIGSRPVDPSWGVLALAVAADGPRVLVSWIEGQRTPFSVQPAAAYARRFRRDGRPIDAAPVLVSERPRTISAASGPNFAVVTDADDVTTVTVLESNGPALRILAGRTIPPGLSDVTWDGRELVVAQRFVPDRPNRLVVWRFDATLLEPAPPPRSVATLPADEKAQPSIAAMAGEVLIAISEGDPVAGARAVVYRERDLTRDPERPSPRRRAVR